MNVNLEHTANGTVASAIVKDSAGEYRHHKLYQGYEDAVVTEMFISEVEHLSTY